MTDRDVERWSLGPPVEVLEAGTGAAFLVVGGRRLPLRGLPLPYLVSTNDMLLFPEGQELNVAAPRAAPPETREPGARRDRQGRRRARRREARTQGRGKASTKPQPKKYRLPTGAVPVQRRVAVRGVLHRLERHAQHLGASRARARRAPGRAARSRTRMPSGSIGSIVQPHPLARMRSPSAP